MADYWKSQPKKFCQYCKCWIADNKPSVEFHERGKNHKENVAAKISEIKKKSMDKAKQDEKNCKEFAAMEAAAMKAYEEDLKRMGVESGTTEVPTTSPPSAPPPQPPSQPKSQPQRREKKGKRSQRDGQHSVESRTQTQVWVPGKSEEGHTYYYNTLTGESKWENPEGFQGESSDPSQTGQSENSTGGGWKEAVSPEGHTYYYHTETGASSWERPADFSSADASEPGPPGESQSQPEAPGTSSPAPAPQEPEGNGQDSQQPKGPKISFRKRKADTESTDKEEEESASGNEKEDDVGEKEQEEASNAAAPVPEKEEEMKAKEKKEEEVKTEEEEGAHITKEEVVERKAQHAKKQRKTTPYGAWEQIQEEEDPYDTVDLQLPHMEGMAASGLDDLPPPEPKPKFRERTVTSLGGEGGGGGPAAFKKSRALNGRARSIRQRVDDD